MFLADFFTVILNVTGEMGNFVVLIIRHNLLKINYSKIDC